MNIKLLLLKFLLHSKRSLTAARIKLTGNVKGKKFVIPRENKDGVLTYLYNPINNCENERPLLVNVHGGAWIMNDALKMDTMCQTLSDKIGAFVVNVNYKKADEQAFPYPQYEVVDTVKYFLQNSEQYRIDKNRVVLMGYSAGAHLCAAAVQMLRDEGIFVNRQVLCYPFADFTYGGGTQTEIMQTIDTVEFIDEVMFCNIPKNHNISSPAQNPNLADLPATIITTCGNDSLAVQGYFYAERLREAGIKVDHLHYEKALHGYIECNWPETLKDASKSPEQELICKETIEQIVRLLEEN